MAGMVAQKVEFSMVFDGSRGPTFLQKLDLQPLDNGRRYFVLNREDLPEMTIEAFRPDDSAGSRIDKLGR